MGTKQQRPEGGESQLPWYAEGLRFECQQGCVACCVDHGDYAYVYIEEDDLLRLTEYLELSRKEFCSRYTTMLQGYRVLVTDEPECPFLKDSRCAVHPARPAQCRSFPFWNENLKSPVNWVRLKAFCPGIDCGDLHDLALIRTRLAESRSGA